jgi:hypothetical protein
MVTTRTTRKELPTTAGYIRKSLQTKSLQTKTKLDSIHAKNCSKKTRDLLLDPIIQTLIQKKNCSNNKRLPRGAVQKIFASYKAHFPWLTINMIKGRLKRLDSKLKQPNNTLHTTPSDSPNTTISNNTTVSTPSTSTIIAPSNSPTDIPTELSTTNTSNYRSTGGRPTGTTNDNMLLSLKCATAAKAEIVHLYTIEYNKSKELGMVKLKHGTYKKIHEEVRLNRNLPTSFYLPYDTVKKRMQRNTPINNDGDPVGHQSPLRDCEDRIVQFIVQLGKIGSPLSCGQCIHLINDLIDGTVHQERLIQWKVRQNIKQSQDNMKRVGVSYWYAFLRRHSHRIRTKKGRKFELDRSNWTKYRNFFRMYEDIEEELVEAGLAEKLSSPIWMDENGKEVEEQKAKGMKVQTRLSRPDMCIVMDEVGCNINMTKDGHVNGTKFVVDRKDEAKQKATKKDKHFTCLGLTLLSGPPLMCVIIVDGKQDDLLVRTGVDVECDTFHATMEEGEDSYDLLYKNMGKGHQYPGGPSCEYEGKTIPCMVTFNPGGGITATILTDILRTLDKLEIFSRKNGIRPFVLLDGHASRFDIEFLEYINNKTHKWSVCIGVPYGTSLWQVGDSIYQNGQFKVRITQKKEQILLTRYKKQMGLELMPTDIIPLVNYGWSGSFANVPNNIKAISERGWSPLNKILLLHPEIRKTMTEKDMNQEQEGGLCPVRIYTSTRSINSKSKFDLPNMDTTSFQNNTNIEPPPTPTDFLSFKGVTSSLCLQSIVQQHDFETAREKIVEQKKEGVILRERIFSLPRTTAARLTIDGKSHTLGEDLRDYVKQNITIKREQAEKKRKLGVENYKKDKKEYEDALMKNKDKDCLMAWTVSDLRAVVKMEKNKDDGPLPTNKRGMVDLYAKCMARKGEDVVIEKPVGSITRESNDNKNEVGTPVENDTSATAM